MKIAGRDQAEGPRGTAWPERRKRAQAFASPPSSISLRMGEHRAREKFAVLVLVEPGALDVEQAKPGERNGIDGAPRERAVGAGVGLVVEDMHRAGGFAESRYGR